MVTKTRSPVDTVHRGAGVERSFIGVCDVTRVKRVAFDSEVRV